MNLMFLWCVHARACMLGVNTWRSEDNLWESVLFVYRLGPKDGIQVVRLGDPYLYSAILLAHIR